MINKVSIPYVFNISTKKGYYLFCRMIFITISNKLNLAKYDVNNHIIYNFKHGYYFENIEFTYEVEFS
jgi:hypothetical protein